MAKETVEPDRDRFPFALVMCPLPVVSWICPLLGHVGICDSLGRVHDFVGSNKISVDRMYFARPCLYAPLQPGCEAFRWDEGIALGDNHFRTQVHRLFTNNCHHHVAHCLNEMEYGGRRNYSALDAWRMVWRGAHVVPRPFALVGFLLPSVFCWSAILLVVFWLSPL